MAHVGGLFEKARGLESQAAKLSTRATTLPDIISEALNKKFIGGPLVKQRETALEGFLKAGTKPITAKGALPGTTEDIFFDPATVSRLRQQKRASAFVPLSSANLLLGAGLGGIPNLTDAAVRAFQAQVQAAQSTADRARQLALDEERAEEAAAARAAAASGLGGLDFGGATPGAANATVDEIANAIANKSKSFGAAVALVNKMKGLTADEKLQVRALLLQQFPATGPGLPKTTAPTKKPAGKSILERTSINIRGFPEVFRSFFNR